MNSKQALRKQLILEQIKGKWTVAEIKVNYNPIIKDHNIITFSFQAYELIKSLWDKEKMNLQEEFAALFFNTSSKLIGYRLIGTGKMSGCLIDIRLLVSLALHCLSHKVIIAHNHPSGNTKPSDADKTLSHRIQEALKLIDVHLADHLIIVEDGYLSFNDEGLL